MSIVRSLGPDENGDVDIRRQRLAELTNLTRFEEVLDALDSNRSISNPVRLEAFKALRRQF